MATVPKLKKLNLSRNRLESWPDNVTIANLESLYFAFNQVTSEAHLHPAVVQNPKLFFLVITGNPFALGLQNQSTKLELLLQQRFGQHAELKNDSFKQPAYLKGMRTATPDSQLFQNMMNYGQSKALVEVSGYTLGASATAGSGGYRS